METVIDLNPLSIWRCIERVKMMSNEFEKVKVINQMTVSKTFMGGNFYGF
jgi:hypothetical protein